MKAANNGHSNVASKLIDVGASVDTTDKVSVLCTANSTKHVRYSVRISSMALNLQI